MKVGGFDGNQNITLGYTESVFKRGNCSALKKQEAPINIVLIYRVVARK